MKTEQLYKLYLQHPSVQTDTRKLKKGDIFFALSGPHFNGNNFAFDALRSGASYAVVDEYLHTEDERIIKVDDTLKALQDLAKYHRQQFNIPFIAITGSNGKTTTKELANAVLASHFITYTTQGNLNNHIGIPLTLLSVHSDAEFAVIEMGANHQREIESYCQYTLPTHGVITNCGKAHLEGFGGIEGVKKGKGELFAYLKNNNGAAFIFEDYDYLREMSRGVQQVVKYGTTSGDITGTAISSEPFLKVKITSGLNVDIIKTQLVGDYNLPNVLCAAAIGKYFSVPPEKIQYAIEQYQPGNSRSQMLEIGTNKVIVDAYNANPTSTKAAIENLAKINAEKKVLMLGGMMELGQESIREHQNIIELIKSYNWHNVALVGGDFEKTSHDFRFFKNAEAASQWLKEQDFQNSYILLKGSRSIKMELVLNELR